MVKSIIPAIFTQIAARILEDEPPDRLGTLDLKANFGVARHAGGKNLNTIHPEPLSLSAIDVYLQFELPLLY